MRLHEHEAKAIFTAAGIPVPQGRLARTAEEAERAAADIGGPVMVKAQVLAGGRGKAGGIRRANGPEEAAAAAQAILAAEVRGERPDGVLVESAASGGCETYLGITVDAAAGRPAAVVSRRGGVDIETTAREDPSAVVIHHVDPALGLTEADAQAVVRAAGLPGAAVDALCRLYRVFADSDALIAEINPLIVPDDGGAALAADAVLEADDAALFRHPDLKAIADGRGADPRAKAAKACGMTFVGLEGDIGLICSGAGLGMATMDLIGDRARPANFLETGGGITRELMAEAARIVMGQPGLRAVLVNVYGGINPIHEGAKGLADVLAESAHVPVVAKALGNFQEETWATLEAAGVTVVREVETEKAVEETLRKAEWGSRKAEGKASKSTAS